MNRSYIKHALNLAAETLDKFLQQEQNIELISNAINTFTTSLKSGGRIISCGNGGSNCDSMHFAEELTGRFRKDRPALSAMAVSDSSHITCVGNDYGFDHIFSRNVDAWGRTGDTLLAISTSGNSPNIIKAAEVAKQKGIKIVGLLGKDGGSLKEIVDIPIIVESKTSDRIQEVHIKLIHIFIEGIERELYPELY